MSVIVRMRLPGGQKNVKNSVSGGDFHPLSDSPVGQDEISVECLVTEDVLVLASELFVLVVDAFSLLLIFVGCFRFACKGHENILFIFSPCKRILRLCFLSRGHTQPIFSISRTGVDFIAPRMRCSCSSCY